MVKIDDLSDEIARALQEYTEEVTEGLEEAKIASAKEGVKMLKKAGEFKDRRPRYRKGWSRKKVGTAQVIHNRTDYQLTHLLEKGHAKRNGGRTKAFEHIAPVEEKVIKDYEQRVEKVIKG